jgi:hypothetical protein
MSKKIELKHIAPYLPYNLKYCRVSKSVVTLKNEVKEMGVVSTTGNIHNINNNLLGDYTNVSYLPILKPLSDLTNEELRLAMNKVEFISHIDWTTTEREGIIKRYSYDRWLNDIPYVIIQYLFSKHYDVFDLIKKGLAISNSELTSSLDEA